MLGEYIVDQAGYLRTFDMALEQFDTNIDLKLVYFDSEGCAGKAYVLPLPARRPFKTFVDPSVHVRPDALSAVGVIAKSNRNGTTCSNYQQYLKLVELASCPAVSVAPPTYRFPFRP
jgi:hypothetical protein